MKVRQHVEIPLTDQSIKATFYTFDGFDHTNEHLLIEIRNPQGEIPSIPKLRIHSECLTGDVFHSRRCDCGKQLKEAIELTSKEGGYIAYLRQEGRGIGLYNKLDAYHLQDNGMDTFEANLHLGFAEDAREFDMVAEMLKAININEVELITNNPKKIKALQNQGIKVVKRVATTRFETPDNFHYLRAKEEKENHCFGKLPRK
ncbi:GTP cyclohydrolase II RibA [Zooshikella marina]|nr:GTP cyclohydrolase II RibA [Zooshikella ganghwensis]MBU2707941.1 GTP cyclohydrolase II RibA [Zooshikella ganghwensis]